MATALDIKFASPIEKIKRKVGKLQLHDTYLHSALVYIKHCCFLIFKRPVNKRFTIGVAGIVEPGTFP